MTADGAHTFEGPSCAPLPVLYQDEFLVAVDKPAGLLVHRSPIDRHETQFALQLVRDQIGRQVFPVHRLDKPTSGVLVFALDPETARQMGGLLLHGDLRKTYLAVARGFTPEQMTIDHPLVEEDKGPKGRRAPAGTAAQPAITRLRRLGTVELPHATDLHSTCRCSLVELHPETGRRHQLRRHLKHIFHPILGDTTHGDGKINALIRREYACARLLLAAVRLEFTHPMTGALLDLRAPPEGEFLHVLARFGWEGLY